MSNPTRPKVSELPANMQAKITEDEHGCWIWKAAVNSGGYGQVGVNGVSKSTHRVAYELLVDPIPVELQIDHLCRVKRCCNPAHLEPVTSAENMRRRGACVTHCSAGHPLSGANLVTTKRASGTPKRNCRTCMNASRRVVGGYGPRRGTYVAD